MKHARKLAPLALAAVLATSWCVAPDAQAAAKRSSKATSTDAPATPRKTPAYHQFSGTVVSLDASSITVFARHAAMRSTGDVAKDARVTVYWRDEAGKPVAHRVVVKAATTGGTD